MLLRFGVRNHLSIRDRQELSFVASSLEDATDGLLTTSALSTEKVLPAAVIYGANASGKSNLISALRFMCGAVLESHSGGKPSGGVPRHPFALDEDVRNSPTEFDIDFVVDGTRYHYGFECSDSEFISEWLYAFPSGKRRKLFERTAGKFSFGRTLRGRNKVIADLTRANSLYLSAAAQNDHEELSPISDFFRGVRNGGRISVSGGQASYLLAKGEIDARVIDFLNTIGTGVVDYRKSEVEVPDDVREFQRQLMTAVQAFANENIQIESNKNEVRVQLAHRAKSGAPVFFELSRESSGTRRLLTLLGHVYRALDEGSVVLIDELDASLHTQACEFILRLFCHSETNSMGAQLIATTHDTNLLRSPGLRRDQIWFAEKDVDGASHLYPLTDIRTRKDDNFERGYLQGRYGAIPFSGSVSDLLFAR